MGGNSTTSNGDGNQVHVGGDAHGPVVAGGGIHIGDGNTGIVITGFADDDGRKRNFTIAKASRVPVTATWIGIMSGVVTLIGFATGVTSVWQAVAAFRDGLSSAPPADPWTVAWLLGGVVLVAVGVAGFSSARFLRRHVLRLPRHWRARAWAGIRDGSGRTFPWRLRLAAECEHRPGRKLRFAQVPASWVDHYQGGKTTRREVTEWQPVAICPRNPEHRVRVDVSGNDFDVALGRG